MFVSWTYGGADSNIWHFYITIAGYAGILIVSSAKSDRGQVIGLCGSHIYELSNICSGIQPVVPCKGMSESLLAEASQTIPG
jgi:hypothetical protein